MLKETTKREPIEKPELSTERINDLTGNKLIDKTLIDKVIDTVEKTDKQKVFQKTIKGFKNRR